jgi:hypothetical protein
VYIDSLSPCWITSGSIVFLGRIMTGLRSAPSADLHTSNEVLWIDRSTGQAISDWTTCPFRHIVRKQSNS